jgi:23S rRNA A2030 N6-methylase RlmJ
VFIVNPPWTLAAALRDTLPWLVDTLAIEKVGAGGTAESSAINRSTGA